MCCISSFHRRKEKEWISILHDGGVCAAPYSVGNVEFSTDLSDDVNGKSKLKFVRVGEKGKNYRCYTTCCGTQMTNCTFPRLIVFNRNGIKYADGIRYEPGGEVLNILMKDAFDPSTVPKPNHPKEPTYWTFLFMKTMLNPFGKKYGKKELYPNECEDEIVPITWE